MKGNIRKNDTVPIPKPSYTKNLIILFVLLDLK